MSDSDARLLTTQFAPAERTSSDEVARQHKHYTDLALVQEFIDALPEAFVVLNEQRQTVLLNKAMMALIPPNHQNDAIGKRIGELIDCEHAYESITGCGTMEACRSCGAVQAILASLHGKESVQECRISQMSGGNLDLRVWATPLTVDGEAFSMFAIQDIADEKRRRFLERLFFHDVLNTANGIALVGDMLKTMEPDVIQDILPSFDILLKRLIDEIQAQQDLLAAESGELIVNPVPINASEMLADVSQQYYFYAQKRQKEILMPDDENDVTFTSDSILVRRVLGNMVKNALEAIKTDECVTLRYYVEDGYIIFEVHNPGFIPRKIQLQIFQRSFSTKGRGRGLGTYSIKMLTENYLQGRAGFDTSREGGTHFWVEYPINWVDVEPET